MNAEKGSRRLEIASRPHKQPGTIGACIFLALSLLLFLSCNAEPVPEEKALSTLEDSAHRDGTIVAVGDSLTAGLGVDEDQAYPAQLARKLKTDGHHYRVVNAGVSGETSSGALSRIRWVISSLAPDIVILESGANDGLRGIAPKLLKANLDQLITILKENNIQVILAGMRMPPNLGPEYTRAFDSIYPELAEKHQIILMPFFLDGVAGRHRLNQADNMHPTAEGYRNIVENLYPYVLQSIRTRPENG